MFVFLVLVNILTLPTHSVKLILLLYYLVLFLGFAQKIFSSLYGTWKEVQFVYGRQMEQYMFSHVSWPGSCLFFLSHIGYLGV